MKSVMPLTLMRNVGALLLSSLAYFQFAFSTFAQSSASEDIEYSRLDEVISARSLEIVGVAFVVLLITALVSLSVKNPSAVVKKVLFGIIVFATLSSTFFLAGSTIYLNVTSSSGGPVHWHADFEIWNCGEEVLLKKPVGFSNKIGTATLHEHDDKRIHLEGVVVKENNASLGNFMKVIGGELSPTTVTVPTTSGLQTFSNGKLCPNGITGDMQVFVYKVNADNTYTQSKIADPASYIISGHSQVPPGDCIIIEFGEPKMRTDKLCRSFKVAKEIHKLGEEVTNYGN